MRETGNILINSDVDHIKKVNLSNYFIVFGIIWIERRTYWGLCMCMIKVAVVGGAGAAAALEKVYECGFTSDLGSQLPGPADLPVILTSWRWRVAGDGAGAAAERGHEMSVAGAPPPSAAEALSALLWQPYECRSPPLARSRTDTALHRAGGDHAECQTEEPARRRRLRRARPPRPPELLENVPPPPYSTLPPPPLPHAVPVHPPAPLLAAHPPVHPPVHPPAHRFPFQPIPLR
uniref:Uncharacterized protein n=1 Tax=Heliothis virescens TaxID=7102 RepID=A0A2A4J463_HELVI